MLLSLGAIRRKAFRKRVCGRGGMGVRSVIYGFCEVPISETESNTVYCNALGGVRFPINFIRGVRWLAARRTSEGRMVGRR